LREGGFRSSWGTCKDNQTTNAKQFNLKQPYFSCREASHKARQDCFMAKKKTSTRRRSITRTVRRVGSRASGMGGKLAPALQGVLGGIAAQVENGFLPGFGAAAGLGGVGYFMNNPTLLTLAGLNVSRNIPVGNFIPGAGVQEGGFI